MSDEQNDQAPQEAAAEASETSAPWNESPAAPAAEAPSLEDRVAVLEEAVRLMKAKLHTM